ncbi:regulator of G-protein signaling [Acrasis kona]|uniref:Regulator of G-protein signaling n=1 Tax=Acrasis kona TaxID=1008807 RepID=A0AAW2ZQP5_9EUKA
MIGKRLLFGGTKTKIQTSIPTTPPSSKDKSSSPVKKDSPRNRKFIPGQSTPIPDSPSTPDVYRVNVFEGLEVPFEILFSMPNVQEHFHEYLKRTHNEDGFLFIMAVNEFKNMNNDSFEQANFAVSIMDTFLTVGSQHEINIDNESRSGAINVILDKNRVGYPGVQNEVFDDIVAIVRKEMKDDGFLRYVHTAYFGDFIRSQGREFVIDVITPGLNPKNQTFHISQVLSIAYMRSALRKFGNRKHELIIDIYEEIQRFRSLRGCSRKECGIELLELVYDSELCDAKCMTKLTDGLDQEVDLIRSGLFDHVEIVACKTLVELYERFHSSLIFNQCVVGFVSQQFEKLEHPWGEESVSTR